MPILPTLLNQVTMEPVADGSPLHQTVPYPSFCLQPPTQSYMPNDDPGSSVSDLCLLTPTSSASQSHPRPLAVMFPSLSPVAIWPSQFSCPFNPVPINPCINLVSLPHLCTSLDSSCLSPRPWQRCFGEQTPRVFHLVTAFLGWLYKRGTVERVVHLCYGWGGGQG